MRRLAVVGTASLFVCSALAAVPARAADPAPAVTHHAVTVGGQALAYTVRAGTMPLRNADGDEIARVFVVAYTADGTNPRTRPVTFLWNGGPGTASMWLQMGSYGPVRVAVPSNATLPAPGTGLIPNPETLLDISDLVFIDAVGTGYSQITGKGTQKTFYGVDEDARAFDEDHPRLDDRQRPLGIAEVSVRRVVRHDARGDRRRAVAARRHGDQRRRSCSRPRSITTRSTSAKARARTIRTLRSCPRSPRWPGTTRRCPPRTISSRW